MKNKKFIQTKKILATLIVSIFFIYFWIEGPIQFEEVLAHLEVEETRFSKPKIVGEDESTAKDFGSINKNEVKGEGWEVLNNKKSILADTKLLSSKEENAKFNQEHLENLKAHLEKLYPDSEALVIKQGGDFFYAEFKQSAKQFYYLESGNNFNHIKGYAGPINIGVILNENGEVAKVQHISSKETQSYLNKIYKSSYYDSYIGIPLEEEHKVDIVSGATITSDAIAKIASEMTKEVSPYFADYFEKERDITSFILEAKNSYIWIIHVIVIGLFFIYGFQKKYKKSKRDIQILAILSILYIGFFMNNSFTYISFLHPFLGTSVSYLIAFYALFSLLGAIWGKNIYCKYVCPFGHSQRIALQLSKKAFSSKFFLSNKWINRIRDGITICLIVGILLGLRSWSNFEVFPDFFGVDYLSSWFFISIIIILINLKYPFIWCRIACPTGAVLDKIGKITS